MIELRHVGRTKVIGMMQDGTGYTTTEKVLQYRFKEPNAHELLHGIPPEYWVWSEWKEVPFLEGA